jgi:hypothetical protein
MNSIYKSTTTYINRKYFEDEKKKKQILSTSWAKGHEE